MFPVTNYQITSPFGWRIHPVYKDRRFHYGVDVVGDPNIRALAAGHIKGISGTGAYGNHFWVDHGGGVETFYAHNKTIHVKNGDYVSTSDIVAIMGATGLATGVHLHFGIKLNGEWVDPMEYVKNMPEIVKELTVQQDDKKFRGWLLKLGDEYITVNETRALLEYNAQEVDATRIEEGIITVDPSRDRQAIRLLRSVMKEVK